MKRKQLIVSVSLGLTILFSILFQSIHSYEHVVRQFSEKQCHHQYDEKQGGITHQHHNYDVCYVCNFAFGSYIVPEKISLQISISSRVIPYFFTLSESITSFSGSSYLLRGPPTTIIS